MRRIVREREFEVLRLKSEEYAEFEYRPTACDRPYRMIVIRKNISHEKGEKRLFDEIRYFFYSTNDGKIEAAEVVLEANDRCDQENLIAQLAGGETSIGRRSRKSREWNSRPSSTPSSRFLARSFTPVGS
jgi:hypothetical protein